MRKTRRAGDNASAIELDLNMNEAYLYNNRALVYASLGDYKQVISDLETALKQAPDHPNREELEKLIEEWQEQLNQKQNNQRN